MTLGDRLSSAFKLGESVVFEMIFSDLLNVIQRRFRVYITGELNWIELLTGLIELPGIELLTGDFVNYLF